MKQVSVARIAGVSQGCISMVLAGHRKPSLRLAARLSLATGTDPALWLANPQAALQSVMAMPDAGGAPERKSKHRARKAVADKLGVSDAYVARFLAGKCRPLLKTVAKLALGSGTDSELWLRDPVAALQALVDAEQALGDAQQAQE